MKRLLLILLLLITPNVFAQDTTWTTIDTLFNPIYYDESRAVAVLSDGSGYVTAGWCYQGAITDENICAAKFDTNGTRVWAKVYKGANGDDRGYGVCEAADGNIAITGYVEDGGGAKDAFLLKVAASDGDSLWMQLYGNAAANESITRGITSVDSDSGFVLCGTNADYAGNNNEFYVIRTDSVGDTVWTKHWIPSTAGGKVNGYDHFQTCQVTSTDHIILAGYTRSSDWNGGRTETDARGVRGLIAKLLLSNGDSVWFRHFDYSDYYSELYQVRELSDASGYIACGTEMVYKPERFSTTNVYHIKPLLIEVNTSGVLQWRTFPPNFSTREYLFGLVEMDDGTFFTSGYGKWEDSSERQECDGLTILFDTDGSWLYTKYWGGVEGDQFFLCEVIDSLHVIISGVNGKDSANYTTNGGEHWITKFEPEHIKYIGVKP